jgi:tetratricopeptide (TPR) repeat protein
MNHTHDQVYSGILAAAILLGGANGPATAASPTSQPQRPEQAEGLDLSSAALGKRIERLIGQLGSDDYATRHRAQEALAKLGFEAYDQLMAATTHPDLEIASRARYLLRLVRVHWTSEQDPPAVRSILQDYEFRDADARRRKIAELAGLAQDASWAALCRLARFEQSALLAKYAAVALMRREPEEPSVRARRARAIREHLGHSSQPAARWVLASLRLREDLAAARPEWDRLVEAEQGLLVRGPRQSDAEIVLALWYQRAIVEREQGDKQAETTARRARELKLPNPAITAAARLAEGDALRDRGLFDWAEAEYRLVPMAASWLWLQTQLRRSEMWHDQGQHLRAAQARQEVAAALQTRKLRNLDLDRTQDMRPEVEARMHYMYACHWERQGDRGKQRQALDQALAADPEEVDTLIACYRLPDQKPEYRQRIRDSIRRATTTMRAQIEEEPENPHFRNQFAWLVANTEGNYDEAVAAAEKAVALGPDSGPYYDTLGRAWFAKGNLENAVKYQALAHQLEPHSGLIAKQLDQFRRALAEKNKKK